MNMLINEKWEVFREYKRYEELSKEDLIFVIHSLETTLKNINQEKIKKIWNNAFKVVNKKTLSHMNEY